MCEFVCKKPRGVKYRHSNYLEQITRNKVFCTDTGTCLRIKAYLTYYDINSISSPLMTFSGVTIYMLSHLKKTSNRQLNAKKKYAKMKSIS
jgi:hypothetical protein